MFNKATIAIAMTVSFLANGLVAKPKSTPEELEKERQHIKSINFMIEVAADVEDVPSELLKALCWGESHYRLNLPETMDGGSPSYGICQVKIGTAKHMDELYPTDKPITIKGLRNPYVNALYAAKYLRYQQGRYGNWHKAVAAYNAGSWWSSFTNEKYVAIVESNLKRFDYKFSLGKPNSVKKKQMRPSMIRDLAAEPITHGHRPALPFGG